MKVIPVEKREVFFEMEVREWLGHNLCSTRHAANAEWPTWFGVTLWKLWHWRNGLVFNGERIEMAERLRKIDTYVASTRN